jgi:hypothetical protein
MHRFIAILSLCVFVGETQSADAQTRSGGRTVLNGSDAARDNRRVMPAANPRFVQEAVRRAKERRTRMETHKRLGQSIVRPRVHAGPVAVSFNPYWITYWESYSPPFLWSPIARGYR